MKRNFNKIKHIQESNQSLEKRTLIERKNRMFEQAAPPKPVNVLNKTTGSTVISSGATENQGRFSLGGYKTGSTLNIPQTGQTINSGVSETYLSRFKKLVEGKSGEVKTLLSEDTLPSGENLPKEIKCVIDKIGGQEKLPQSCKSSIVADGQQPDIKKCMGELITKFPEKIMDIKSCFGSGMGLPDIKIPGF